MKDITRKMANAETLTQDFLHYNSLSKGNSTPVQETFFNKIQIVDAMPIDTLLEEDSAYKLPQEKIASIFLERSLPLLKGKFKKKDAENMQRIKELTRTLINYDTDHFSFKLYFNMIINIFKNLKASSSKLAAFLYVLDSTEGKELETNSKRLYKELPRKYKKMLKKTNPRFSVDMHSSESAKSIEVIRAHLKKRAIFIGKNTELLT